MVHVAYELAQVKDAQVFYVDAIDEHLAFLHIIVAWYEVHERRLARSRLSHDGNGLAFGNGKIDVLQHPLLAIAERYVAKLYLVLERGYMLGMLLLLDGVLGEQYLVYALHRGQSLGDVIACL